MQEAGEGVRGSGGTVRNSKRGRSVLACLAPNSLLAALNKEAIDFPSLTDQQPSFEPQQSPQPQHDTLNKLSPKIPLYLS
jgi:hypothetical protein